MPGSGPMLNDRLFEKRLTDPELGRGQTPETRKLAFGSYRFGSGGVLARTCVHEPVRHIQKGGSEFFAAQIGGRARRLPVPRQEISSQSQEHGGEYSTSLRAALAYCRTEERVGGWRLLPIEIVRAPGP